MRALAVLVCLLIAPSASACSIAYQEFYLGDVDGDVVVTALGQDAVRIDLATGVQTTLAEDYFPGVWANDGYVFIVGQVGLGADCSGDGYFEIQDGTGAVVYERGVIDAFDTDGNLMAFVDGSDIIVLDIGTWAEEARISYPRGTADHGPFAGPSQEKVALALDASARQVAVTDADHDVLVISFDEVLQSKRDLDANQVPAMDWHQGDLIVGVGNNEGATFHIIGDGSRSVTLESQHYAAPQIAAGQDLLLQHGNTVVRIHSQGTQQLDVPADYAIGSIAADAAGAALFVQEATDYGGGDAVGIQALNGAEFTEWFGRTPANAWLPEAGPAFAWSTGPALVGDGGEAPGTGGGQPVVEDKVGVPFPAIVLVPALLLARRRA